MSDSERVRVGFIGMGAMARFHLGDLLGRADTQIEAFCEPSPVAARAAADEFTRRGLDVPPSEPEWQRFMATYARQLDVVFIATPHNLHFVQAAACLEAGLDVLLEKPMVMTASEAMALIEARDHARRLLVVAFQGSLSAQVREASRILRSGELGRILNVNAMVWQNWATLTDGSWRQDPLISGGGFLFDTGAHMLNTVADLVGEPLTDVAAWLENDDRPVDVRAVVMARLASGALVTMNACGSAIPSCHSDIRVFTTDGILRTGVWGEALELQRAGANRLRKVAGLLPVSVWQQFLNVRGGRLPNPSPPEAGLRMARLWDAIRESSRRNGSVIGIPTTPVRASSRGSIPEDHGPAGSLKHQPLGVEVVG